MSGHAKGVKIWSESGHEACIYTNRHGEWYMDDPRHTGAGACKRLFFEENSWSRDSKKRYYVCRIDSKGNSERWYRDCPKPKKCRHDKNHSECGKCHEPE